MLHASDCLRAWQVMFARDFNTVSLSPGTIVVVTKDALMNTDAEQEGVPILVPSCGFHNWTDLRDYRPTPPSQPAPLRLEQDGFSFWNGNVIKIDGGWTPAYIDPPSLSHAVRRSCRQSPMEEDEI